MARAVLDVAGLQALLDTLRTDGYLVIGPTVRDGAVVPAPVTSVADLPRGVRSEQAPAHYRLRADDADDAGYFGYAATAVSWKPLLFPAHRPLWRVDADGTPRSAVPDATRRALIGVRSCDLQALAVLDRVLAQRAVTDPDYLSRRGQTFVVAVTCGIAASTCFCASMDSGPAPRAGFDIALTEIVDTDGHRFLADAGSDAGSELLSRLPSRPATGDDERTAAAVVDAAVAGMTRSVDTDGITDVLHANAEHPRWDDVSARCLGCTNCTLVCPTCFCVTTEDVVDLTGPVGRDRVWDSCFHPEHSHLHGGPVRSTIRTRYRQWLTHKFGSWVDQFGVSGCVGCGRCIAWCPAGIDVTEELAAIRATAAPPKDEP